MKVVPKELKTGFLLQKMKKGSHVTCESPITLRRAETEALYGYAKEKGLVLFEALKTAYFRAFSRLVYLMKGDGWSC